MLGLATVQERNLPRLLQAILLSGVLVPLATAQAEETRLPVGQQAKPAPPEVSVPVGQGAIPRSSVVVSDTEVPREFSAPAAGALRPGNPQGYVTPTGGASSTPGVNRYAPQVPTQGLGTNPLPGFSAPKSTSALAPQATNETLEPVTGQHEPMPTPAAQDTAPQSAQSYRNEETTGPVAPQGTTEFETPRGSRSILSSKNVSAPAPAAQPEDATANSQAEVAVPRYATAPSDVEPMPTPAEPASAVPARAPVARTPIVSEAAEPGVPASAPVEAEVPVADAPVPFPSIPVPVPKTAAVPLQSKKVEIAPATFREVEPGVTTLNQLVTAWGEPLEKKGQQGDMLLLYKIDPFPAVHVRTSGDAVSSILIRLDGALAPEVLAERLQLDTIRTVEVRDDQGQLLGRAFPERGVLFGYDPSFAEPAVAQVLLETVDTQAFYLRAETYWRSQSAASLEDLNYVIEQNPADAVAMHLIARIYLSLGQVDTALEAVDKARGLDPEESEYRLTRAQCLSQLGKLQEAEEEVSAVRDANGISTVTKGRACMLQGDLLASGTKRNYKGAIALHMEAIKLVEPLTTDPLVATRRKAKEVLLEATLAVASDVAWGNWNRKEEVVPKWIEKADACARDSIEHDGGGLELRMMVIERALAAHTGFKPAIDPARFLSVAAELTTRLTDETKDPLAKQAAEWELGCVYNHAVRLAHIRGAVDDGFKFGQIAQEKLENSAAGRGSSLEARNELGSLYFHIGVLYAIHRQDHEKAVGWYDRATDLLVDPNNHFVADPGQLGEMLVSMGVSYWQVDLKQKGLELTTLGTDLVKQAVDQGTVASDSLLVPYGNLASMHAELGHPEKAKEINLTAEKLQHSQLK